MKTVKIIAIIFATFFLVTLKVHAQNTTLSIVAIEYETREDIDFLFQNSTQVLEYLEGFEVDVPTFLSLVSKTQQDTITENGYKVKVLAENADLEEFVLLYNPQPNQADTLRSQGEPIVISSYYTLLKLSPGQQFTHEGAGGRFFEIPFSKIISPPPLQEKTVEEPVVTPVVAPQASSNLPFIIAGIIGAIFIVGIIVFILTKRKRTSTF